MDAFLIEQVSGMYLKFPNDLRVCDNFNISLNMKADFLL